LPYLIDFQWLAPATPMARSVCSTQLMYGFYQNQTVTIQALYLAGPMSYLLAGADNECKT